MRQSESLSLQRTVDKLVLAARQVGFTPGHLIALLDSGVTLAQVLDYMTARASGTAIEN